MERISCLTDEQVALLEDVPLEEVPALRELALEEATATAERGRRVVGLLLPGSTVRHIWTPEADAAVLAHRVTDRELAVRLGVTTIAVRARRENLKHPGKHERSNRERNERSRVLAKCHGEEWTKTEDDYLLHTAGPLRDIAAHLGRTLKAVEDRRWLLRKGER